MNVIALEAAQNSLDIYQTANGCGVCYNTVPSEVFKKIINLQDDEERFMKEKKDASSLKGSKIRSIAAVKTVN